MSLYNHKRMNKRHLHHLWTKLRRLKPRYFLAIALLSTVVCVFALRANNQQMIQLRNAVNAADKAGGDVQTPLKALQSYVTSHMNTDLNSSRNPIYPPIQLQYTYKRLVDAQSSQFQQANADLYSQAQAFCEQQNPTDFSGRNRVPCITQYVTDRGLKKPATIPDSLYKFSFASPRWSPDLAGWSMLLAGLSWLLLVISFIVHRWFRHLVR